MPPRIWTPQPRHPRMNASRRRFLQFSSAALSGVVLSNCTGNLSDVSSSESSSASPSGSNDTLNLYAWSAYTDDEVFNDFTDRTGFKVVADIYDSNETMLAKMQAGGGDAYSIIYPSDYMVQQMVELDMLTAIDHSQVEGLKNVLDKWVSPVYDPNNQHSVPYSWGTTGFVYNSEALKQAPTDWDYLWDNQESLNRKMTLLNDVREVLGGVLRSLGYSYNSTDPAELEAAYEKLVELKPAIASFTTDGWRDQLVTGDLVLAMGYSVDAIDTMSANPQLRYVIPASGSSLWTDTMVIPKTAPNAEAAYAWINYMYEAESGAAVVDKLKIATPNQAAFELVSDELKSDKTLFPPEEILANCEGIAPVGDTAELYDKYWTQLTSA